MSGGMWIVHLALFLLLVNLGSAIKCYVCSNAKNVKTLYSSNCYKSPNKLQPDATGTAAGIWECAQYNELMAKAIAQYRTAIGRANDAAKFPDGNCGDKDYTICRSFYYQADFEYLNHDGKLLGTLSGSNERVFRSCGCLMDPNNPNSTSDELLKNLKVGCNDYKQGPIRKRYCQCKKDTCNSAYAFKTNIFGALLAAAFPILRLSVGHF